jgi:predicted nucleotidyltransferase
MTHIPYTRRRAGRKAETVSSLGRVRRAVLDVVRSLLPYLTQEFPDVDVLYVFGSTVTGKSRAESDIDIAVYVDDRNDGRDPLFDLRLGLWLQDRLGRPVDVIVMNTAAPLLRYEVLRTGVRLFERSPARRSAYEVRAFKEYVDFRHYQRKRIGVPIHGQ